MHPTISPTCDPGELTLAEMTITRTYTFADEDTCKYGWTFTLTQSPQDWFIEDLHVEERENPHGCSGHPKTIVTLLKGRKLDSINRVGLTEAACGRSLSCGQALAQCMADLSTELV